MYWINDPDLIIENNKIKDKNNPEIQRIDQQLQSIVEILRAVNPLASKLKMMKDIEATTNAYIHTKYDDQTTGEDGEQPDLYACTIKRDSLTKQENGNTSYAFVNRLNRMFEPLQYPLLFPCATSGWFVEKENDVKQFRAWMYENGARKNGEKISLRQYCRQRILRDPIFQILGPVVSEWAINMESRNEENIMNYWKSKDFQKKYQKGIDYQNQFQQRMVKRNDIVNKNGDIVPGKIHIPTFISFEAYDS